MSETKRERNRRKGEEARSKGHAKAHDMGLGEGHEKHHDDPPPVSAEPVVTIVPDNAEDVIESMKDFTWNKKQRKPKKQKKQKNKGNEWEKHAEKADARSRRDANREFDDDVSS